MPCKNCGCGKIKLTGGSPASRLVMKDVKIMDTCNKFPNVPRLSIDMPDGAFYSISSGGARKNKRRLAKKTTRKNRNKTRSSRVSISKRRRR